jgi:hypothetical protein
MSESTPVTALARGVAISVSDTAVELFVPRLFGDRPIRLRTDATAVCRPDEIVEPVWDEGARRPPPLQVADLALPSDRPSLLLVSARPLLHPPVRPRARFTTMGFIYHRSRHHLSDGFRFPCPDTDAVVNTLAGHGVQQTRAPYAWVAARRAWPGSPEVL